MEQRLCHQSEYLGTSNCPSIDAGILAASFYLGLSLNKNEEFTVIQTYKIDLDVGPYR